MQLVTEQIQKSMEGSSWIRKMFEKGLELKTRYGADAVCDFSLGNPDVPPPAVTKDVLETIAADAVKPLGLGYCPNAGIPAVREAMAQYVSRFANKGTALSDLQMRLPVTRLQTACVGDSGNDVAMMHNAVISICVGDRSDELASVCNVSLRSAEESLELIRRVNEALRAE